MEPYIRKYRFEDKEKLRYICKETAGEFFRKSESMLDAVPIIYSDYFTENEPENIFVIDDGNGNAAGYIICSADFDLFCKKMLRKYIPKALKTSSSMLPACAGYTAAYLFSGRKDCVHLHIDILPEYQHMGFGSKLIDTLRVHLNKKGIENLSVNTVDRTESAYKFYMKYGFKEKRHFTKDIVSLTIPTKTEGTK